MLINKKHQKRLHWLWVGVSIIVILGMILLYSASLFI